MFMTSSESKNKEAIMNTFNIYDLQALYEYAKQVNKRLVESSKIQRQVK